MLSKTQTSNPVSKNYQDYEYAYAEDYSTEGYDDAGYDDMVPEDEFIMDEEQGPAPLDIDQVRDEIRRLLQLAQKQGADAEVLDTIRNIAGQVNFSASLPEDRRVETLNQAMADLSNLEVNILSEQSEGPSAKETDADRKQEISAKIEELAAKIEDPALFQYALERDDLREKLEKAKASLDLGDMDSAEMAVMEIESAVQSHEAEIKSETLEGLAETESTLETVKDYLQTNILEKYPFAKGQETLDQLDSILTRMRDGAITHEAAEAEARQAVQELEDSILAIFPEMVRGNLAGQFGDLWGKATAVYSA
ncbi:MAG: hypothetical protein U1F66_05025 [bacterium]